MGIAFLSLFSVETIIWILDWFARWDWLNTLKLAHPHVAALFQNPFSYVVLLILGFGLLFAERKLKAPRITGRIISLEGVVGNKASAFAWLDKAYQARSQELIYWLRTDPAFDDLRADPKYKSLVQRIGFPE